MRQVQQKVDLLGHVRGRGVRLWKEVQAEEQQEVPQGQEREERLSQEAQVLLSKSLLSVLNSFWSTDTRGGVLLAILPSIV